RIGMLRACGLLAAAAGGAGAAAAPCSAAGPLFDVERAAEAARSTAAPVFDVERAAEAARSTSSRVTRPPGPVPATRASSTPSSAASLRATGLIARRVASPSVGRGAAPAGAAPLPTDAADGAGAAL